MNNKRLYVLVCAGFAFAASAADLAGHWEGEAVKGNAATRVLLDFSKAGDELTGAVSFPRSGVLELPVTSINVDGNTVRLAYTSRNVERVIEGTVDGDGLTGTFTMEGDAFDVSFERVPFEKPYAEEDIVYSNGDVKIAATLFVPKAAGPHPALVMLHGSGDNERNRYRFLADFYARMGIACLFADKRGCGDSGGDWREVGFEPLAWDGIKGVEWLQQRDDIDPNRIGMTGISQAGWVMTLAASLFDDVKFLVVNSASIESVEEEGYYDYMVALKDQGHAEDVRAKALAILKQNNHVTRTGDGYDELMDMVKAIRGEPWRKDFPFIAMGPESTTRDHYRLIIDHDPVPILEKLDRPILWNFGEDDKSVDTAEGVAELNRIKAEFDKDYTINVYPGANHGLFVEPDPAVDALPFSVYAPGYLDDVRAWLTERVLSE
jgi:uncharacterized protein